MPFDKSFFLKNFLQKFKPLNDPQTLQVFPINFQKKLIRNIFFHKFYQTHSFIRIFQIFHIVYTNLMVLNLDVPNGICCVLSFFIIIIIIKLTTFISHHAHYNILAPFQFI